jgi:hypothetical protein
VTGASRFGIEPGSPRDNPPAQPPVL